MRPQVEMVIVPVHVVGAPIYLVENVKVLTLFGFAK